MNCQFMSLPLTYMGSLSTRTVGGKEGENIADGVPKIGTQDCNFGGKTPAQLYLFGSIMPSVCRDYVTIR